MAIKTMDDLVVYCQNKLLETTATIEMEDNAKEKFFDAIKHYSISSVMLSSVMNVVVQKAADGKPCSIVDLDALVSTAIFTIALASSGADVATQAGKQINVKAVREGMFKALDAQIYRFDPSKGPGE